MLQYRDPEDGAATAQKVNKQRKCRLKFQRRNAAAQAKKLGQPKVRVSGSKYMSKALDSGSVGDGRDSDKGLTVQERQCRHLNHFYQFHDRKH